MFNPSLKQQLRKWENHGKEVDHHKPVETSVGGKKEEVIRPPKVGNRAAERVLGGEVLWKPVNREAAKLIAKSSWIFHPPPPPPPPKVEPEKKPKKKHKPKRKKIMGNKYVQADSMTPQYGKSIPGQDYVSEAGIRIVKGKDGEPLFAIDDVNRVICQEVAKLPDHVAGPVVKAAIDSRKVINELLDGIGEKMEKFKVDAKLHIQDIRQTRFAVVSECSQMTKELAEVRQFLMGPDHSEQIKRLTEFVDLCERLKALKDSGFLDTVADTMIRLA